MLNYRRKYRHRKQHLLCLAVKIHVKRPCLISAVAAVLMLFSSAGPVQIGPDPIRLIPQKLAITPTEFFIKNVSDERQGQPPVARLYFAEPGGKPRIHSVDLDKGADQAISDFMIGSTGRNTLARPVNIRVKECQVRETIAGDKSIRGEISLTVQFDLEKEYGNVNLTQYRSTAKYTRSIDKISVVEPVLSQLLLNSIKYINTWMERESLRHPLLAKSVRISFTDYLESDEDTLYYHPSRPLTWDDFREKPQDRRYSAAVFSSFGYDQHREIANGTIHVNLAIKVYMVRSASWVFPRRQDTYGLNHEQKHFDIVKIISKKFKNKLLSENLTPDNYEGIINFEYLEFYREMNRWQKQYDLETAHGSNAVMQRKWDEEIERAVWRVES